MNGNIVIVGDINIDWFNANGYERKRVYNILETFGFVQNICTETHRSHHLLDYNITRKDCNIISDCTVSDFISDHLVLHASLQCIRPHPVRKQIADRSLRRIKEDALAEDMDRLQTTQPTSGGAVTADSSCCANCVEPPRPQQWGRDLPFLGMPAMRTRWIAGAAAHKSG